MIWLDIKYMNILSLQLDRFKLKNNNPYLANFRCPFCGDSVKDKKKARGYIFAKNSGLIYKCHNCGVGTNFKKLLKLVDKALYNDYNLEYYKEKSGNNTSNKLDIVMSAPQFEEKRLLDRLLDRLSVLPEDNRAVLYAKSRKLPKRVFDELYYIEDMKQIDQLSPKYKDKIVGTEDRLLIPFYNRVGSLIGVHCRALGDEKLRYVSIRINDNYPMIYNYDKLNFSKPIFCFEGPFDSMFIENSCAVGNLDLVSASQYLPRENTTFVFDNKPRNKDVVYQMRQASKRGFHVFVWPASIEEKDLNEYVQNTDATEEQLVDLINKNTFHDLTLRMKINNWSKIS